MAIAPVANFAVSDAIGPVRRGAAAQAMGGGGFADALSRAATLRAGGDLSAVAPDMTPRQAAEELVATAFVKPILASMRDMNQAQAPFAPTAAEKQFAPMLDAILARQIVRSGRLSLVDAVARQMRGSASARAAPSVKPIGGATDAERRFHARPSIISVDKFGSA